MTQTGLGGGGGASCCCSSGGVGMLRTSRVVCTWQGGKGAGSRRHGQLEAAGTGSAPKGTNREATQRQAVARTQAQAQAQAAGASLRRVGARLLGVTRPARLEAQQRADVLPALARVCPLPVLLLDGHQQLERAGQGGKGGQGKSGGGAGGRATWRSREAPRGARRSSGLPGALHLPAGCLGSLQERQIIPAAGRASSQRPPPPESALKSIPAQPA